MRLNGKKGSSSSTPSSVRLGPTNSSISWSSNFFPFGIFGQPISPIIRSAHLSTSLALSQS